MAYKPDQGRMVRMAVFWSLAVLLFYGCMSLRAELAGRVPDLAAPLIPSFPQIPVLGIRITGAFLIVAALFAGGIVLLWRWQEKPKTADLLIETENELKKVTWPTGPEVVNSSIIVIVAVVFLMAYLAGADWFLGRITQRILFGG